MTPTDIVSLALTALAFLIVPFLAIQQRKTQRFLRSVLTPLIVEKAVKKRTVLLLYREGSDEPEPVYVGNRRIAASHLKISSDVTGFQFADEIDVQLGSVGAFVAYTNHSPLYKRVNSESEDL